MANKIYLYKANLNKSDIEILATFPHEGYFPPTRINNLNELNLSEENYNLVSKKQKENQLQYELMVESSETYDNFLNSLKSRGYKNMPITSSPSLNLKGVKVARKVEKDKFDGKVKRTRRTMLRSKY